MAYADYAYYVDTFRGNQLSEQEFASFAERAADWIDYLTDGKADGNGPYSEKIKKPAAPSRRWSLSTKPKAAALSAHPTTDTVKATQTQTASRRRSSVS